MLGLSLTELLVILVILLLLFGAKKLPELARSVGTSMGELRKGMGTGSSADSGAAKKDDDQNTGS